ncbi:histidine phosphatase family protein [Pleurocapsa sp. PCC 7319]|uniref:histidine phosphatase family protein n=1 Tax=Pleurocapsa sp. PCC 7319 TaxID=118161 RepID=UPI00034DA5AC|nr:histidine phosphatase family protein [Pleurocapsa sp. PCC 7319]
MNHVSPSPVISLPDSQSTTTTKVILVRHARTNYNEQGRYQGSSDASVLTAKGHKDAYRTGLALQQFSFDAIYTSPLTRVQQTTQEITFALQQTADNLPTVITEPKLTEIQMSDWQGLFYQEVKEKFSEAYRCWLETPHLFSFSTSPTISFPVLDLFQQAENFWHQVLEQHRGQTILVVAHGGTNRALISTAIGLNPEHYHSLQQSNCGISCLEFSHTNYSSGKLSFLNVTDHLSEDLPKLKAGNTGWRWLLLSNQVPENLLDSSALPRFVNRDLINCILTDNSQMSEHLANKLLKFGKQTIHLSVSQDCFLESWQQTIFNRQQLNYDSKPASLITGLIIAPEKLLSQIVRKTLGIATPLEIANHLSVIHYPHGKRQSILQGVLPINNSHLADKLNNNQYAVNNL